MNNSDVCYCVEVVFVTLLHDFGSCYVHVPWTLELEMLYLGLVFYVHTIICFFFLLYVFLQFLVKACCSPLYGEGFSASWVSLSLFPFVLLRLHIVCQVKHFLHLAW